MKLCEKDNALFKLELNWDLIGLLSVVAQLVVQDMRLKADFVNEML